MGPIDNGHHTPGIRLAIFMSTACSSPAEAPLAACTEAGPELTPDNDLQCQDWRRPARPAVNLMTLSIKKSSEAFTSLLRTHAAESFCQAFQQWTPFPLAASTVLHSRQLVYSRSMG
jgi:hypothetical protein